MAHPIYDVLIIGSGAAGLSTALYLPESMNVAVIAKDTLHEGATRYAQGGIAAVLDEADSIDRHVADTLDAGAGLCHPETVRFTSEGSKAAINRLVELGVEFDRDKDDQFHLTQEGGHSHRRIIHSADATGKAVSNSLVDQAIAAANIKLYDHFTAVDLIKEPNVQSGKLRCAGAYVLNQDSGEVELLQAKFVVIATGGASKVYLYTSNPDSSSGDGIAMAWRSGCRVGNLEFNQFHPTCLYHPEAKTFLVTEALRGEGAHLKLPNGERFMHRFDERLELAPRDIVARAIDHEMKRLGSDCLYLDISHKPKEMIEQHFPTVRATCLKYGIDITKQPIPIVPAAHYTCGGILTDHQGKTDLENLYAVGECAFTGLHGANRMASNSLLECLVFAQSAANDMAGRISQVAPPKAAKPWDASQVTNSDEAVVISHNWDELRRFMWDYVGIVRTKNRLQRADHRIKLLQREITEYYSHFKVTNDLLELRNLATVAQLIIWSAKSRKESRGLHYTSDYPDKSDIARDTILVPRNFAGQQVIVN